jgi:hypothetical protein
MTTMVKASSMGYSNTRVAHGIRLIIVLQDFQRCTAASVCTVVSNLRPGAACHTSKTATDITDFHANHDVLEVFVRASMCPELPASRLACRENSSRTEARPIWPKDN